LPYIPSYAGLGFDICLYSVYHVYRSRDLLRSAPSGPDVEELETFYRAYSEISAFVQNSLRVIKPHEVKMFIETLVKAYSEKKTILVMGAGRSGLVGRAFAMRLRHLGFNAYVLGDTIVSPIRGGDVAIAISGSGRTALIVTAAEAAKSVKAVVVAITSFRDSPLARIADVIVQIPGRTKVSKVEDYFSRQILGIHEPLAPLGTLFEVTAMVFLDSVIPELMKRLGVSENDMLMAHANIEM